MKRRPKLELLLGDIRLLLADRTRAPGDYSLVRALAFDILAEIGLWVDPPEVVSLARRALRKAQFVEAGQAADFLKRYFAACKLSPDDETTDDLLALARKAGSRGTALSALNALVETGTISEFEALSRLDEWKSRH